MAPSTGSAAAWSPSRSSASDLPIASVGPYLRAERKEFSLIYESRKQDIGAGIVSRWRRSRGGRRYEQGLRRIEPQLSGIGHRGCPSRPGRWNEPSPAPFSGAFLGSNVEWSPGVYDTGHVRAGARRDRPNVVTRSSPLGGGLGASGLCHHSGPRATSVLGRMAPYRLGLAGASAWYQHCGETQGAGPVSRASVDAGRGGTLLEDSSRDADAGSPLLDRTPARCIERCTSYRAPTVCPLRVGGDLAHAGVWQGDPRASRELHGLSVCKAEVCVETTSVVDTHELLMAGRRDDARGHDHVLRT